MSEPIYRNKGLWRQDLLILWWMLLHQEMKDGTATGELPANWRAAARAEFGLTRQNLWKCERRLRTAGVIDSAPWSRKIRLVAEAFQG